MIAYKGANPEYLDEIEKQYDLRFNGARKKAISETKELIECIDYYRRHSLEEIAKDIEEDTKRKFDKISDDVAIRRGLFIKLSKAYEEKSNFAKLDLVDMSSKINKEIDNIIKYMTDEDRKKVIDDYKRENSKLYFESELEKANGLYDLFNSMNTDELNEYVNLFHEFRFSYAILDARESAVRAASKKSNTSNSIDEYYSMTAVEEEIGRIIKSEEPTEKELSFKDKVLRETKDAIKTLNNNPRMRFVIPASGIFSGGIASILTFDNTYSIPLAMTAMFLTIPVVTAALTEAYHRVQKADDNDSVKESKELGIFDKKLDLEETKKNFFDFDEKLRKKYSSLEIVGGNDGLHK